MSLINRMLDDLAARQAPGAESLRGVRLSDPMAEAQASLNSRKRWVLIAVALGAATVVWSLWPTRGQIPVPQTRAAVGESVLAPPAAMSSAQPVATSASSAIVVDGSAPEPLQPALQLASSLGSLHETGSPAVRIEDLGGESVMIVDEAGVPEPAAPAPAPRIVARPPALRSATSIGAAPEPLTRSERHSSRSNRRESALPNPDAGILAAEARAPVNTTTTALPASRTDAARDALSRGDPAAALELLGPMGADRDVEGASLRAAALQRLGRHREAADVYRGLTQGGAAEPGHWVGLAISLEGQQKREEARIAYRRALQSPQLAPSLRAFAQTRVTVLEEP